MENQYILTPYFMGERASGLDDLAQPGWVVNRRAAEPDIGPDTTPQQRQEHITTLLRPLRAAVAGSARAGRRPVSIAGDCIATLGVLAGLHDAGTVPSIIWFDAHGDFNTWETTPSGFLGGMPLAMIAGRGEQTMMAGVDLDPLPASRILLAGARDLDPGEKEAVAASGITHFADVTGLLDAALPPGPLYVHFDADVLDPGTAPAMYYPAANGPDAETLRRVFERLAQTGRVVAASLSSWAPELDEDGQTRALCMDLLSQLGA